jgi:DNA-binding IclR family transcriptional regulator
MSAEEMPENTQQGIKSIEIGARVLLALEQGRGAMALSAVARQSDLHPAKVHRYLTSLVRTGLASRDPSTGLYDLGPAARHLGVEALRRVDSVRIASNHAVELRDDTAHTVNLAAWSEAGPVLVDWATGAHTLPIVIRVGSVLPLLDSAVGYIFMTYLSDTMTADALAAQQRQETTRTMSAKDLRKLREETRSEDFARTRNQMILGLSAMAAPVFGASGELEVAMGLIIPAKMTGASVIRELGAKLRATADRASHELGYAG